MTSSARPRIKAASTYHRKDAAMTPAPVSGELCSVPAAGLSNPVKPIAIHLGDGGLAWCQWGVIEYPCPRPDRGEVGPTMLVTAEYLRELLDSGPQVHELLDSGPQERPPGTHSVTVDGRRVFAHHYYRGQRWTWELFPAYFDDNLGPPICIGRRPD